MYTIGILRGAWHKLGSFRRDILKLPCCSNESTNTVSNHFNPRLWWRPLVAASFNKYPMCTRQDATRYNIH
jgi:hypothetical protein